MVVQWSPDTSVLDFSVLLVGVLGVEGVAEAVAERVEGEDGQEERASGEDDEVGGCAEVLEAVDEQSSPAGGGRLCTQSDEAEEGFGEDRLRDREGCLDEYGACGVGE